MGLEAKVQQRHTYDSKKVMQNMAPCYRLYHRYKDIYEPLECIF